MIDLKDLRTNPDKYRRGATDKLVTVDIDALLQFDAELRQAMTRRQELAAEKNRIGKQIGGVAGRLKKAGDPERPQFQAQIKQRQERPNQIKQEEAQLSDRITCVRAQRDALWLAVPQPADLDVPVGTSAADNIELRRWNPPGFDTARRFEENRGFVPRGHIELMKILGMVDLERGVKMAGTRSYVLKGDGMRLHQAILRYAFDFMTSENGFTALSVPTLVRDQLLIGTGFFPHGRDQVYEIANRPGSAATDGGFCLTGTAEVGLMGFHEGEILDCDQLPLTYTSMSTCYRREAGAAGKDTAGLFRIHQFDKVEQVVICRADEKESRHWHQRMIGYVETLMQRLQLPYRLLQCCTADLGPKSADMIDIEAWMPGRGPADDNGRPTGAYGETHSASRLYDYQCRRLNLRYRDPGTERPVFCHALNNTVAASPRILIPIVEIHQNEDASISIPEILRPYLQGQERIS